MKSLFLLLLAAFIIISSCDTPLGPNEIGGSTDLPLTQVGNEFNIYPSIKGIASPAFDLIKDSIIITKNVNGIVTFKGKFTTNETALKSIDTMLGTASLPEVLKHQIVDTYLEKYGATIDTSDHYNLRLDVEFKLKITSEGIQDFIYSDGNESKPFTIVKYSSNVGDKYEYTAKNGVKIVREVVQKNPTEDWNLSFWTIKTIRVEEKTENDPVIKKMTYIANHKFGLVGVIIELKDGKIIETQIVPWDVL